MADPRRAGTLIAQVLEQTETEAGAAAETGGLLVGECTDARHPVLAGRVKVRWPAASAEGEPGHAWLPCLQGLVVRAGDRVLLSRPANWPELLVTGVVDGLHRPAAPPPREAGALELRADESLVVRGQDGAPLLELRQGERGPSVRLMGQDLDLEVPGRLCLRAAELQVEARRGDLTLEASDDVVVRGEMIELN